MLWWTLYESIRSSKNHLFRWIQCLFGLLFHSRFQESKLVTASLGKKIILVYTMTWRSQKIEKMCCLLLQFSLYEWLTWSWWRKFLSNSLIYTEKSIDSNGSTVMCTIRSELILTTHIAAPNDAKPALPLQLKSFTLHNIFGNLLE